MATVDRLNFRTSQPQFFEDHWRNKVRRCDYKGHCPVCGRKMYFFEDGENDPRGPLGDHAATYMTPKDEGMSESEIPFWYCFMCANEEPNYRLAVELLRQRERS